MLAEPVQCVQDLDWAAYPRIKNYLQRTTSRPAYQATVGKFAKHVL